MSIQSLPSQSEVLPPSHCVNTAKLGLGFSICKIKGWASHPLAACQTPASEGLASWKLHLSRKRGLNFKIQRFFPSWGACCLKMKAPRPRRPNAPDTASFEAMPGQGSLHVWTVLGEDTVVRLSFPDFQGWSCWEKLLFTPVIS